MSDTPTARKRLLVEFVLADGSASPNTEVALDGLGIDIPGFTVDTAVEGGMVSVNESRHGPTVLLHGTADEGASVGSNPRVVGVWLDKSSSAEPPDSADHAETVDGGGVAPEWSDPDVEGPERYLF